MLTKAEKEKRVIELYEQDAPYRVIAKEVHFSLSKISSIIKRYTGEAEKEGQQQRVEEPTTETKVFNLLEDGKTPIQVATSLNLPAQEVTRLYREYLKLKGLQVLDDLYEDIGDDVFQFHRAYELTKEQGYTPRQLIEAADHLDELPLLRSERERLKQENQNLGAQQKQLNESFTSANQNLSAIKIDIEVYGMELERIKNYKLQLQKALVDMNTSSGYQQLLRTIEGTARSILTNSPTVLSAAVRAVFQALKDEPRNVLQMLVYGSLEYPMYEPGKGKMPQNYLQLRQAMLLQAADEVYRDLLAKCVNTTMSSVLNLPLGPRY